MINNILVPFDFSQHAIAGLDYAIEISKLSDAKINVLHVIEFPVTNTFSVEGELGNLDIEEKAYVLALFKKTKHQMNELLSTSPYDQNNISSKIIIGRPYQGIIESIDDMNVDMVVMGTKGATGIEEMLVGSNAEKIVRKVKCPVITLHDQIKYKKVKNLLCAIDISSDNDEIMEIAKRVQSIYNSKIHLLWVNTPTQDYGYDAGVKERMQEIATTHGLDRFETHITAGIHPDEGIIAFGQALGAELIAIATHSRKGLAHLLLGSVAEDTVNHSPIPVLTITLH